MFAGINSTAIWSRLFGTDTQQNVLLSSTLLMDTLAKMVGPLSHVLGRLGSSASVEEMLKKVASDKCRGPG